MVQTAAMPEPVSYQEADLPAPGSVFLVPLEDGRFGAVRITRRMTEKGIARVRVIPCPWVGAEPVLPAEETLRAPLLLTHHAWNGKREAFWVFDPPPPSHLPAGTLEVTPEEAADESRAYGDWENAAIQILTQWRWDHDRVNLLREEAEEEESEAERERTEAARHQEMPASLTLPVVAQRAWFSSWSKEVDGAHVEPCRRILADFIRGLSNAMWLTRPKAGRLLKEAVGKFNALDDAHGFIETTHREDICEALILILHAARKPDLAPRIDEWRTW